MDNQTLASLRGDDLKEMRAEVSELRSQVSDLKTTVAVLASNIANLLEERRREQVDAGRVLEWVRQNMDGGISSKVGHLETAFLEHAKKSSEATAANTAAIAKLQSYVLMASGGLFVLGVLWALVGDVIKEVVKIKFMGR